MDYYYQETIVKKMIVCYNKRRKFCREAAISQDKKVHRQRKNYNLVERKGTTHESKYQSNA